jgi:tRNA threonylcarbamoyladenosine biosynthesis protein TsaB
MLLAIDTSNEYAGVALWDTQGLRGDATWYAGRYHTEQVLPQIDLLLQHLGRAASDLRVVAVATGPGSWSGLRAGMSLAKSLAIGLQIPILGIPTLQALLHGQRGRPGPVLGVVRLGRDRFAAAVQAVVGDEASGLEPDFRVCADAEVATLVEHGIVVGDLPVGLAQSASGLALAPPSQRQRRAALVAELAWQRFERGESDDPVALEPIYAGSPVRSPGPGGGE